MAKRSGFTSEDLDVLDKAVEAQIANIVDGDDNSQMPALAKIQESAPLFRVREKVIAMQSKANAAPTPKASNSRATRNRRVATPPAAAVGAAD